MLWLNSLTRLLPTLVLPQPASRLWIAAIVTAAFAMFARRLRGVTTSGAVAGAAACFLLYAGAGSGAFVVLALVFAITWITTRLGYQRKQRLGTAEKRDGRTAGQVLANLAVAAVCAGLSAVIQSREFFLLAASAALSEAAADTVSSELGQAWSDRARLITTWDEVAAGTDGGVTLVGTVAGFTAAIVVSGACVLAKVLPFHWLGISIAGAVAGMVADSLLGAVLERRKVLTNNWVNLLSTLMAAGVAFLWARGYN